MNGHCRRGDMHKTEGTDSVPSVLRCAAGNSAVHCAGFGLFRNLRQSRDRRQQGQNPCQHRRRQADAPVHVGQDRRGADGCRRRPGDGFECAYRRRLCPGRCEDALADIAVFIRMTVSFASAKVPFPAFFRILGGCVPLRVMLYLVPEQTDLPFRAVCPLHQRVVLFHFLFQLLQPVGRQAGTGRDPAESACQRTHQREQGGQKTLHIQVRHASPAYSPCRNPLIGERGTAADTRFGCTPSAAVYPLGISVHLFRNASTNGQKPLSSVRFSTGRQ